MNKNDDTVQDEITLVNYLSNIVSEGLLGRKESVVLGEEPSKKFFAGVLFPYNEDYVKNLSKNYSMGLEYLVKPKGEKVNIEISGSFNIYVRVFPEFKEQIGYLTFLKDNNYKNEDNGEVEDYSKDNIENCKKKKAKEFSKDKGIKLLQKYQVVKVNFEGINIKFDLEAGHKELKISFSDLINEKISCAKRWKSIFSVKPSKITRLGAVEIKELSENDEQYKKWIESIGDTEVNIPVWNAYLNVNARSYKTLEGEECYRIITTLVNNTAIPQNDGNVKLNGHALEFYDCNFSISISDGKIIPFEFEGAPRDYKYDKSYEVKGINCVGLRDKNANNSIRTEVIPRFFQSLYRTRTDLSISFKELTQKGSINKSLNELCIQMKRYLMCWESYIAKKGDSNHTLNAGEIKQCIKEKNEFEDEIKSFELGLYALNQDKRLMDAFINMNKVFMNAGEGKYTEWRLFQIVFIIRIIPSLYAREVSKSDLKRNEIIESLNYADVLWFPTGGGKTEAYLGLIVCNLFYDRLRGKKTGCSAWIRFPLRMLSKQQLDRLARILIFAEEYRENDEILSKLGRAFSIGFFAGSSNTANFISKDRYKKYLMSSRSKKKAMLIHKCPKCGSNLELDFDQGSWRLVHKCTNAKCFVSKSKILKGMLPIYITDSEVYRFVPSVLCGTVDKLAILSRYREFSHIFGQVTGYCSKHGYLSDRCIVGSYDRYGDQDGCTEKIVKLKKSAILEQFYDPNPTLFIQDELHLLKEDLGVLNGHYEGALSEFARTFGRENYHLPKIIAATATIESYERHINHLYLRQPRKYPSMGYKKGESFYATSMPKIDRRLYIGILPHTRSQDEIVGRCLYLYNKEIQNLYLKSKDIWKKFNFKSIDSQEKFIKLLSMYDLSVIYVNQKTTAYDVQRRINENVNIDLKRNLNQSLDLDVQLLTGDNDMDKIVDTIDRIESENYKINYNDKLHVLIATSLISHGVDLERINCLFMAGMPSKQAEYIQASSRSARTHAGIVFAIFKSSELRERSQYQYFIQNHEFMDRLVDPVPINRLSVKAIEKSIPGLLSGLLMCVHSQKHKRTIYNCKEFKDYISNEIAKGNNIREEIKDQLKRIIGTDNPYFSLIATEKANEAIDYIFDEKEYIINASQENLKLKDYNVLNPITSFRDIEEGIEIEPNTKTSIIMSAVNKNKA
ncbi:DEAD/DEAH box helicase [Clostridium sp. WILCCON 0269]|uniref:DEAD/DEAH box helicase n=1 Tax=Candidatus Clostridium eludens TaxID=3381663 RepID=A0ABW8SL86_9CLOT